MENKIESKIHENIIDENKLLKLRELMQQNKYDAYIIPHSDRHDVIK